MQEREEVSRELLEAHGDAAESLDSLKEALDEASLLVEMSIDRALACTVNLGRDDNRATVIFEHLHEWPCVVRLISSNEGVEDVTEKLVGELHLVRLAWRER